MGYDFGLIEINKVVYRKSLLLTASEVLLWEVGSFEALDTAAACRTFNVLVAEGKRVVLAALID